MRENKNEERTQHADETTIPVQYIPVLVHMYQR